MLLIPVLSIMAIEDFRHREINWYWFPVLCVFILLSSSFDLRGSLINFLFLGIQFFGLTVYFSLKEGRVVNITDCYLGLGDMLFLLLLSLVFSPVNFLIFFITSLVLWLGIYLFIKKINLGENNTIPLVGCLAVNLILLIITARIIGFDLNNELSFLSYSFF